MQKPFSLFFGGPRRGLAEQRDEAISRLKEMQSQGIIKLECFDAKGVETVSTNAKAYLMRVAACHIALFALGSDPGTIYESGRNVTTFTFKEWELALKLPIPVYLLLTHHLEDSFINAVQNPEHKLIWQKFRDCIPEKHIIIFKKKPHGDLSRQVSLTVGKYLSEKCSLVELGASWVIEANSNLFQKLDRPGAAKELEDALKETGDLVGRDEDQYAVKLIACAYMLRRSAPDVDLVKIYADAWLKKAWLLMLRRSLATQDILNLSQRPLSLDTEISEWQKQEDFDWFAFVSESYRALLVRWLLERGLVHRYKWNFSDEVKTEKFAMDLAEKAGWNLGSQSETLHSRLYEVYIAALIYAGQKDTLTRLLNGKDIQLFIRELKPLRVGFFIRTRFVVHLKR